MSDHEASKEEFCARFVAEMLRLAGDGGDTLIADDGSLFDLRKYAEETAATYWEDPDDRAEGPEVCAETDISYWGD